MQRKFSGELHKVRQHMCFKLTYIFNLMLDEFIIQCFAQANRRIIIKYYFKLFIDFVTDHRQQFRSRGFTKKKVCKHDRRFYKEMYGRREKKFKIFAVMKSFFFKLPDKDIDTTSKSNLFSSEVSVWAKI